MSDSTKTIKEAAREIPVRKEVDVLVAGGGLGGVSAAIASARAGAKTLLVERNGFLGGTATAGMCCSIFNCFYTSDHKLGTTGIPLEIADTLAEMQGYGKKWHNHKGHIIYDVEQAKLAFANLIEEAGGEMLVDTVIAGAVMDGDTLRGVIIESKSGREAILARVVVDATGDADVAARAGAPLKTGDAKFMHSFCFRLGNVDVDRFVKYFEDTGQYPEYMDVDWNFEEVLAQYRECGTLLFPHGGAMQLEAFQKAKASGELPERVGLHHTLDACQMHAIRDKGVVHVITGQSDFDGLNIETITRSINDGRRMAYEVTKIYKKYIPGFENAFVVTTADDLGVRASRWIDGDFVFESGPMTQAGARHDDAIGRTVHSDILSKHPGKGAWGVQIPRSDSFDIPYRCLLPKKIDGLLMGAGRSVSADNPFVLRCMGHTMVVGQGAGAAAAVAAKTGTTPRAVDVADVQAELRRQGVELG